MLPIKDNKISIHVIPNASATEIKDISGNIVHIRIAAPPDKNKANAELIKFFKKEFKLKVQIISGEKSRDKIIELLE